MNQCLWISVGCRTTTSVVGAEEEDNQEGSKAEEGKPRMHINTTILGKHLGRAETGRAKVRRILVIIVIIIINIIKVQVIMRVGIAVRVGIICVFALIDKLPPCNFSKWPNSPKLPNSSPV